MYKIVLSDATSDIYCVKYVIFTSTVFNVDVKEIDFYES